MKNYKLIFLFLLGLSFMAGSAKARELEFEPLTPEVMAKFNLNQTDVDALKKKFRLVYFNQKLTDNEDIIITKLNDVNLLLQRSALDCGSAACFADGFKKENNQLIFGSYPETGLRYDCLDNEEKIICYNFNPEYIFYPLKKNMKAPEGAQKPYLKDDEYSTKFLDAIDDCFTPEGCPPASAEVRNNEIVITGRYHPLIRCLPADKEGVVKCRDRQDFEIYYYDKNKVLE